MTTKISTKYLDLEGKQNLGRYAGEWVAFVEGKIFSHNRNLTALMKEVKIRGLEKKASVFLVPRKDEGPYILVLL